MAKVTIASGSSGGIIGDWVNPPAVTYAGATYMGWIGSDTKVRVAKYDGAMTLADIVTATADVHFTPSLWVRADGRITVFYTQHSEYYFRYRVSTNPRDVSAFDAAVDIKAVLGGTRYAYPNPVALSAESSPMWLFYRDYNPTGPKFTWCYSKSANDGDTWVAQTEVYRNGTEQAYVKVVSDGVDTVHFLATEKGMGTTPNRLGHFYYRGGSYYKTDGTKITATLPLVFSDITEVWAGGEMVFPEDIAIGMDGRPVIVAVYGTTWADWTHAYLTWNGSAWVKRTLPVSQAAFLGRGVPGGMALDREDPRIVYVCDTIDSISELFRYATTDGGVTWKATTLTSGSSVGHAEPHAIRGGGVAWMQPVFGADPAVDFTGSLLFTGESKMAATMDGLASLVDALTPVSAVYGWPVENITPPAVVVGYPARWDRDSVMAHGADTAVYPVWLVVGKGNSQYARNAVSRAVAEGDGVAEAIDGSHAFGSYPVSVSVTAVEVTEISVSGVAYLAARFDCEVIG